MLTGSNMMRNIFINRWMEIDPLRGSGIWISIPYGEVDGSPVLWISIPYGEVECFSCLMDIYPLRGSGWFFFVPGVTGLFR